VDNPLNVDSGIIFGGGGNGEIFVLVLIWRENKE
jgi:hypothetical protein